MPQIDILGDRLDYRMIEGSNPSQPTLVFVHHGLGSVELWRDFPDRLASALDCPAMIYSRIGYGKSGPCTWPRPVSFLEDQGLTTLPALLKTLSIDDAVLVGHSEGATISLVHAGNNGAGIRGVVAEAPHLFTEQAHIDAIGATKKAFETTDLKASLQRYHGDNIDCAFYGWAETWLQPGFRTWSIEKHIPPISCPVLGVRGADDEYGTHAQLERLIALSTGPLETQIVAGGHAPHEEDPDKMVEMFARFIQPLLA